MRNRRLGAVAWRRAQAFGLVAGLAVCSARAALAQVTPTVPLDAPAYDRLNQLVQAGLVRTAIVGQRPWSRREVARITAEARATLDSGVSLPSLRRERLRRIVALLEASYGLGAAATTGGAALDGAVFGAETLDGRSRPIEDVGLGSIDASVEPLVQGRAGRPHGDDVTIWSEAAGHAVPGRHVALNAGLRAVGARGGTADREPAISVTALSVTAGASNVVVEIGRQPVLYGQGITGGPFATRNAPALDMIRVGTDEPAYLPWLFRRLGPARGSLFVADLGADAFFPHTKLAGWKMSFLPSPRFEIGASLLSQQGGRGAPPARWYERAIDVLTIIDVLVLQDRDLEFSNKLAGVDARWRSAPLELYFDGMLDDFDVRRIGGSLWEDAGYAMGFVLPQLGAEGAVQLGMEYQHTGLRFYQHGQFQSGVTTRGHIIGLPLGPRGDAVLADVRWDGARGGTATLTAALERRSGDRYVTSYGENDAGWRFVKTEDRPEELRARLVAGTTRSLGGGTRRLEIRGGVEHVVDDAFVAGARRTNALASVALVIGFR